MQVHATVELHVSQGGTAPYPLDLEKSLNNFLYTWEGYRRSHHLPSHSVDMTMHLRMLVLWNGKWCCTTNTGDGTGQGRCTKASPIVVCKEDDDVPEFGLYYVLAKEPHRHTHVRDQRSKTVAPES
jgi:hypothetical protein